MDDITFTTELILAIIEGVAFSFAAGVIGTILAYALTGCYCWFEDLLN